MAHTNSGITAPRKWGALLLLPSLLAMRTDAQDTQRQPFVDRVEVARVLIDARVFDDRWRAISDLEVPDFAVQIDGMPVRVESVEWIGGAEPEAVLPSRELVGTRPAAPRGRLIVLLVQKDLEPSRMIGLLKMSRLIDPVLRPLTGEDRVAVLSFDSYLKIWTDFTANMDRVRALMQEDLLLRNPPAIQSARDVSLLSRLDQRDGRKIYSVERAMQRIADALAPLPGAKSIVLLGYGFGRFDARSGSVTLMDGYDEASIALQQARVAVFSLNVTQANNNSLQAGLESVSADTGGFYASTYDFPKHAVDRVVHALAGHYVLFVEKPSSHLGTHHVDVSLVGRKGTVLARNTYFD